MPSMIYWTETDIADMSIPISNAPRVLSTAMSEGIAVMDRRNRPENTGAWDQEEVWGTAGLSTPLPLRTTSRYSGFQVNWSIIEAFTVERLLSEWVTKLVCDMSDRNMEGPRFEERVFDHVRR
jgi:hypothetical protein